MKKIISIFTCLAVMCSILTACSGSATATEAPASSVTETPAATTQAATTAKAETVAPETTAAPETTVAEETEFEGELQILVPKAFLTVEDPAILKTADAFMEKYPKTKITIEGGDSTDLVTKFTTSALAGSGADIIGLDNSGVPIDMAAMGVILPLNDRIEASSNNYLQGPLDSGYYEGQYYSVPWYYNNAGLYYNERILNEIGKTEAPATWEEFEEDIKLATEKGYEGITTILNGYPLFAVFASYDNPVIDVSGDRPVVTVNDESGKEAFNFWTGLHTKYNAFPEGMKDATKWASVYSSFVTDDCLFLLCGDWAYTNIVSGNPDLQVGMCPLPQGTVKATTLGGYNLGINVNAKNPDLAWAFIEFLTSSENDEVLYQQGRVPARPDVDEAALLDMYPHFKVFLEQAEYTMARPRVKNEKGVDEMLCDAFKKVLFGQMNSEDALAELEAELNDFIDENY